MPTKIPNMQYKIFWIKGKTTSCKGKKQVDKLIIIPKEVVKKEQIEYLFMFANVS